MRWLLDWLLGLDRAGLPPDPHTTLELGSPPAGTAGLLALLGLGVLLGLVLLIHRRELRGRVGVLVSLVLLGSRVLVILLLALVLCQPRLAVGSLEILEARTVVLLDESLSMTVGEPARADQQAQLLQEPGFLEGLARHNELRLYVFGQDLRQLRPGEQPAPRADATDLAGALQGVVEDAGGTALAAVIVISDGRRTMGADPVEVAREILVPRETPVHAVLVGDDRPPRNLRVVELLAPERVHVQDPLLVEVTVLSEGFGDEELEVELVELGDVAGGEPVLASARVSVQDGVPATARLTHRCQEAGVVRLEARLAPREEEVSPGDNGRQVQVEVLDRQTRVLLVAGGPSHEYRFLKELLRRERTVDLSVWLQSADREFPQEGNTRITSLPLDKEGLEPYDVLLLLDPDPRDLSPARVQALCEWVSVEGGGLGYICGDKFTLELLGDVQIRDLVEMLPAEVDLDVGRDFVGFGRRHETAWRYRLTPEGLDHPVTRMAPDPVTSRRIWERLPGCYWHLPVLRARPGARVLVQHGDPGALSLGQPRPLLVTGFHGPGRLLFLATDETARWRGVARRQYEQLWMQALRYLSQGKLLGGTRQVSVVAEVEQVPLGATVPLQAQLRTPDRRPLELEQVGGVARAAGEERPVPFLAIPGRPGAYAATLVPWSLGPCTVTLELSGTGGVPSRGECTIQVLPPQRELGDSRADRVALEALADATGGELVPLQEAVRLGERIPSRRRELVRPGRPIELWDTPLTAILLIGLLALELILRKRRDLP